MPREPVIENGDLVKDIISGMEGIVVCVTTNLNGSVEFGVRPRLTTIEGSPAEGILLNENELELVEKRVFQRERLDKVIEKFQPTGNTTSRDPKR